MNIQKQSTFLPKYFIDFHNYFNNTNEELVSYTYIPKYIRKQTKKTEALIKNHQENEC